MAWRHATRQAEVPARPPVPPQGGVCALVASPAGGWRVKGWVWVHWKKNLRRRGGRKSFPPAGSSQNGQALLAGRLGLTACLPASCLPWALLRAWLAASEGKVEAQVGGGHGHEVCCQGGAGAQQAGCQQGVAKVVLVVAQQAAQVLAAACRQAGAGMRGYGGKGRVSRDRRGFGLASAQRQRFQVHVGAGEGGSKGWLAGWLAAHRSSQTPGAGQTRSRCCRGSAAAAAPAG